MNNTLEIRILEVFKHSSMNRQDFVFKLGISNAVLSHLSSGRNKAGTDLVVQILTQFPDINPDWLILGNGVMLRSESKQSNEKLKNELLERLNLLNKAAHSLEKELESIQKHIESL